jgi:multisite-specific tRNA:(cytosine-C5)-methyltransferase
LKRALHVVAPLTSVDACFLHVQGGKRNRPGRGRGSHWKRRKEADGGSRSDEWATSVGENDLFEKYYREQKVCPEEEWPELLRCLKTQLPITFRINSSGRFAQHLLKKLESDFLSRFSAEDLLVEGQAVSPPKPLPWYPNNLAWQFDFSRSHLRRIPALKMMHEFIKMETETGSITRQEAVSMIPPLFLDVQPHHRVLDMCAAPGSKTFQMLESLHDGKDGPASGVVVGNDADSHRCATLTHQAQRMRSPSLIITNHEAQSFPSILDSDPTSDDAEILWDRILCDVPCSGDGTVRKQPDVWNRWNQNNGNGLHLLQLKIAMRAAELLKVGGRMVYSTCTFNPIEDEAVVAELLRRTHGALKLVDVSDRTSDLKFQPGLVSWKVMDSKGNWHESFESAKTNRRMQESMFPRPDVNDMGMELTMRFLPHHQNTGGFYVSVLEKTGEMPPLEYPLPNKGRSSWPNIKLSLLVNDEGFLSVELITPDNGVKEAPAGVVLNKKLQGVKKEEKVLPSWGPRGGHVVAGDGTLSSKWAGLDPIVPYSYKDVLESIADFYGIQHDCPILTNLVARTADKLPRKLMYMSKGPKLLLQMDDNQRIKVISAGVRAFERLDSKDPMFSGCLYRLSQEGIHETLPHITKQLVHLSVQEFDMLLRKRSISIPDGESKEASEENPQSDPSMARPTFQDADTLKTVLAMKPGCCVALLSDQDLETLGLLKMVGIAGSLRSRQPFVLPCWKGRSSLSVMVSKVDCHQMAERIEAAQNTTGDII